MVSNPKSSNQESEYPTWLDTNSDSKTWLKWWKENTKKWLDKGLGKLQYALMIAMAMGCDSPSPVKPTPPKLPETPTTTINQISTATNDPVKSELLSDQNFGTLLVQRIILNDPKLRAVVESEYANWWSTAILVDGPVPFDDEYVWMPAKNLTIPWLTTSQDIVSITQNIGWKVKANLPADSLRTNRAWGHAIAMFGLNAMKADNSLLWWWKLIGANSIHINLENQEWGTNYEAFNKRIYDIALANPTKTLYVTLEFGRFFSKFQEYRIFKDLANVQFIISSGNKDNASDADGKSDTWFKSFDGLVHKPIVTVAMSTDLLNQEPTWNVIGTNLRNGEIIIAWMARPQQTSDFRPTWIDATVRPNKILPGLKQWTAWPSSSWSLADMHNIILSRAHLAKAYGNVTDPKSEIQTVQTLIKKYSIPTASQKLSAWSRLYWLAAYADMVALDTKIWTSVQISMKSNASQSNIAKIEVTWTWVANNNGVYTCESNATWTITIYYNKWPNQQEKFSVDLASYLACKK